jgi:gamma-glutamylcyclotransferase (GGCT)/AIG2-like uncharacterized protein YtfP
VPRMFLNGTAMAGGSMHHLLEGSELVAVTRTAARYHFYSVRDEFPGLYPVAGGGAIVGEVYELSYELLRDSLLPGEPAELELSVIELEDGGGALSMRLRSENLGAPDVHDITQFGGWREYLRQLRRQ